MGPELLSVMKKLAYAKGRIIFLTGHGGVVTLRSFAPLGITRREIFASRFSDSRVGNCAFYRLCDEHVPIHCCIVLGPDVVAKVPKHLFIHVSKKKVLLTKDAH